MTAHAKTDTFPAVVTVNKARLGTPGEPDEVRELIIEVDHRAFQCEAGQSIGIFAPTPSGSDRDSHLRWYSVADIPSKDDHGRTSVSIFVRRIVVKNPDTGQMEKGRCSNYLCDAEPGDTLKATGPYGIPFAVPSDTDATIICIGTGTGIAPFRNFVKTIHRNQPDRKGPVYLFYGTRNGLDVLYTNNPQDDLVQYFDKDTFAAFNALSPSLNWSDPISWDMAYSERGNELLALMEKKNTHIYVAGRFEISQHLDELFAKLLGSNNAWALKKSDLRQQKRWAELLY